MRTFQHEMQFQTESKGLEICWSTKHSLAKTRFSKLGKSQTADFPPIGGQQSDSRAKKFGPVSVELDAIDPNRLRTLVEEVIIRHLPPDQYAVLIEAEKSERTLFQGLAGLVRQLAQRKATGTEHS